MDFIFSTTNPYLLTEEKEKIIEQEIQKFLEKNPEPTEKQKEQFLRNRGYTFEINGNSIIVTIIK